MFVRFGDRRHQGAHPLRNINCGSRLKDHPSDLNLGGPVRAAEHGVGRLRKEEPVGALGNPLVEPCPTCNAFLQKAKRRKAAFGLAYVIERGLDCDALVQQGGLTQ